MWGAPECAVFSRVLYFRVSPTFEAAVHTTTAVATTPPVADTGTAVATGMVAVATGMVVMATAVVGADVDGFFLQQRQ